MLYNDFKASFMKSNNLSDLHYKLLIKKAQLWHNPLNFDDGTPIKVKYGWASLFNEELNKAGFKKRYYYRFHDHDMTDADAVLKAFYTCNNFKRYSEIWMDTAPDGLKSVALYLLAITEMTVRGFKHEDKVVKQLEAEGKKVIKSTFQEDYGQGVDLWVDGKPVQIKSPGTVKGAMRAGVEL